MDATHIHLVLTHFPIVGTFIGIGVLAYGQFSKNDSIKKLALLLFILMAVMTIPVFLTGEEAEETVEHIAGISENLIEQHEELAEKAIWAMGLLGMLSLLSFFAFIKKSALTKTITLVTLIVSTATGALFVNVGYLGGQIRHSEIRTNGNNNLEQISTENDDDD